MPEHAPRWICRRCGTRNPMAQDDCRFCLGSRREMSIERWIRTVVVGLVIAVAAAFLLLKVL